jgi:hypothetical protein
LLYGNGYYGNGYLLLLVCVTFLLHDDDQELLALLLELRDLGSSLLQFTGHHLDFLARLVDLEQTVLQLVGGTAQFFSLLVQQPEKFAYNKSVNRSFSTAD